MKPKIYFAIMLVLISCTLLYMASHEAKQLFQDSKTDPVRDSNKASDMHKLGDSHARALPEGLLAAESHPDTKKEPPWEYNDGADEKERLQHSLNAIGGLSKLRGNDLHNGIANVVKDMHQLSEAINENHKMFLSVESEKIHDSTGSEISARLMFFSLSPPGAPDVEKARKEYMARYRAANLRQLWASRADAERRTLLWALNGVLDDMVNAKTITRDGAETIMRQVKQPPVKLGEFMGNEGADSLPK